MKITSRDINVAEEILYFFKNCLTLSVREKEYDGMEMIKIDIPRIKEMESFATELFEKMNDEYDGGED